MAFNKISTIIIFVALGVLNATAQETTDENEFHPYNIAGSWYVLKANGFNESALPYQPRCWSVVIYNSPSEYFRGFSIFLDNKTDEHVTSHFEAVQYPYITDAAVFNIFPPQITPVIYFVAHNIQAIDNYEIEGTTTFLELRSREDSLPLYFHSLLVTRDQELLKCYPMWAGCFSTYSDTTCTENVTEDYDDGTTEASTVANS